MKDLRCKILKIHELYKSLISNSVDLATYLPLQQEILTQLDKYNLVREAEAIYYSDLDVNALNTSIIDFIHILRKIPAGSIIADIGSAHSLMSIVGNALELDLKIINIEPIFQRFIYAKEFNEYCSGTHIFLPTHFEEVSEELSVDYFFIYLPTGAMLENILAKIKKLKSAPKFILAIESHGDLINRLDYCSNLTNKSIFSRLYFPRLDPNCYIYKYQRNPDTSPVDLFIENFYSNNFVIEQQDINGSWIASTKDATLYFHTPTSLIIECTYPPRTIKLETNKVSQLKLLPLPSLDSHIRELIFKIQSNTKIEGKFIRKIYLNKNFCELSDGTLMII